MKKQCRVFKNKTHYSFGGYTYEVGGGIVTQDSGTQPVHQKRLESFMSKLTENSQNFAQDEGIADQIAIRESINQEMPEFKKGGGWMKEARSSMNRKGTVGKFTEYCGGRVTNDCIERGLNSPDETVRKRAQFAKAARTVAANKSQWGGFVPMGQQDLPMAQDGTQYGYGQMNQPGTRMDMTVTKKDPNLDAWEEHYNQMSRKGKRQFRRGMANTLDFTAGLAKAPTRYALPEDQALFDDLGQPISLDSLEFTGYTPGKGGKTATLDYRAKGTTERPMITMPEGYQESEIDINNNQTNQTDQTNQSQQPQQPYTGFSPSGGAPGTTHGYADKIEDINEKIYANNPYSFGIPTGYGGMRFQTGNQVQLSNFPDLDVGQIDEGLIPVDPQPTGFDWTWPGQDVPEGVFPDQPKQYMIDENAEPADNTIGVTQDGSLELERQGRLKTMMQDSPYKVAQGILGMFDTTIGVGTGIQTAREEDQLAMRKSDPFRRYHTQGKIEGDRTPHTTQKIGNNLTPTRYTRKGYGTKVAQMGYEVGQELDGLTPEEIEELLAQGYELEFID
jgi:hypothetical protein